MSDTSQGAGWWLASDGKWYPPELWTGPPGSGPFGSAPGDPVVPSQQDQSPWRSAAYGSGAPEGAEQPSVGYDTPTGPPPYPGTAPNGTSTPYGTPSPYRTPYPYGGPSRPKNNGLAVAALVCGICGFVYFIPAVLGIVFGFVARSQIKNSGGTQTGSGLALAGIIVGSAWIALLVLVVLVAAVSTSNSNGVVSSVPLVLVGAAHP